MTSWVRQVLPKPCGGNSFLGYVLDGGRRCRGGLPGKQTNNAKTSLFNGVRTNSSSRGRLPDAKWLPSGHGSYKIAHKLARVSCRTNKRSPGRRRGVMIRFGECNDETTSLGFVLLVLWHIARATCLNIVSFFPTISSWIRKLRIKEFVAIAAYYGKITAMLSPGILHDLF